MADRSRRSRWKALAAGCCLASSLVWLAGCTTIGRATGAGPPAISTGLTGAGLRALQFNLCNSGIASCYTGRSVAAAAALIHERRPDIVTLDEVCREDVSQLMQTMSQTYRGMVVASAFKAAADRRTSGPFKCRNGEQYGIGVLALIPSRAAGYRTYSGVYPTQDLTDPEERVWVCIHADTAFYACATHAASTSAAIALAQCQYFLASAVPTMRGQGGKDPVILGADLNLPAGHSPSPQSCLPAGYQRADDGARQDVIVGPHVAIRSRAVIDMHGTTDHPALSVLLDPPH